MKNRISPRDLSLPKHPELMKELNDLSIAIKLHYTINPLLENTEKLKMIREGVPKPTWREVTKLLEKVYKKLDEERYNPIKY